MHQKNVLVGIFISMFTQQPQDVQQIVQYDAAKPAVYLQTESSFFLAY